MARGALVVAVLWSAVATAGDAADAPTLLPSDVPLDAWATEAKSTSEDSEPPESLSGLASGDDEADTDEADTKRDDTGTGGSGDAGAQAADGTGGSGIGATQDKKEKRGLDALGVPLVSYNSDLGWGVGLVGGGYYYSPGYTPYRHAVAAQVFLTTEGVQNHWLRYDGPSLIGNARLEVRAEFRRELFAPFYGAGNISGPDYDPKTSPQRSWSFDHFFPGGWVRLRHRPLGPTKPLEVFGGYGYHWVRVKTYEGSALEQLAPIGVQGGSHGQLFLGAFWDRRDNESDPTRGGIEEIAIRISGNATGSRYNYAGITLNERRYFTLGTPKLILAQRLVFDALFGEAPFFEWSQFGGTNAGEGIGGMSSVRGVPRNRYQGKVKVLSNTELRYYPLEFGLLGEPVKLGPVFYVDVGRVWHEDVTDGAWHAWHPGVGTGLRLARRAAVLRFDLAVATETWRPGVYITFGHMY